MKKCPYCAEWIQDEAIFCRYCRKDISPNLQQLEEIHTNLAESHINNYVYKLDIASIMNQKVFTAIDLSELAKVEAQSYTYSNEFSEFIQNLTDSFIKYHHIRSLLFFERVYAIPELRKSYFNTIIPYHASLERVAVSLKLELIRKNISIEESDFIINRVVTSAGFIFILTAKGLEDKYLGANNYNFGNINKQWNDTFMPALHEFVKNELPLSFLYFVEEPTINFVVNGQTPFVLELKRLYEVWAPNFTSRK